MHFPSWAGGWQVEAWAREADKELDFRVEAANLERVRTGLARERSACVVPKVVGVPHKTVRQCCQPARSEGAGCVARQDVRRRLSDSALRAVQLFMMEWVDAFKITEARQLLTHVHMRTETHADETGCAELLPRFQG
jgi:hypothetical protein